MRGLDSAADVLEGINGGKVAGGCSPGLTSDVDRFRFAKDLAIRAHNILKTREDGEDNVWGVHLQTVDGTFGFVGAE